MEVWVSPPDLCKVAADPTPLPNPAHQWLRVFNINRVPIVHVLWGGVRIGCGCRRSAGQSGKRQGLLKVE